MMPVAPDTVVETQALLPSVQRPMRLREGLERRVRARPAWALLSALLLGLMAGRALRGLTVQRRKVRRRVGPLVIYSKA